MLFRGYRCRSLHIFSNNNPLKLILYTCARGITFAQLPAASISHSHAPAAAAQFFSLRQPPSATRRRLQHHICLTACNLYEARAYARRLTVSPLSATSTSHSRAPAAAAQFLCCLQPGQHAASHARLVMSFGCSIAKYILSSNHTAEMDLNGSFQTFLACS